MREAEVVVLEHLMVFTIHAPVYRGWRSQYAAVGAHNSEQRTVGRHASAPSCDGQTGAGGHRSHAHRRRRRQRIQLAAKGCHDVHTSAGQAAVQYGCSVNMEFARRRYVAALDVSTSGDTESWVFALMEEEPAAAIAIITSCCPT